MFVGLKSWRSREWSCGGLVRWSSGREKKSCTAVGRAWSENLGDRDDRVDMIGSGNLPLVIEFEMTSTVLEKRVDDLKKTETIKPNLLFSNGGC